MDREKILSTVRELPVETKIKAWTFQVDKKYYQMAECGGNYGIVDHTSVWECNKRGKRISSSPLFTTSGKDHMRCFHEYIDILEKQENPVE